MLLPEIWSLIFEIIDPPDLLNLGQVRNVMPRISTEGMRVLITVIGRITSRRSHRPALHCAV